MCSSDYAPGYDRDRMTTLPRRLSLMATVIAVALIAAACGRATDEQINQALGITPTATLTAEQITAAAAAASATSAARQLAQSSPSAAVHGDVTAGKRQFDTWCTGCHGPGGSGPDILATGSAGATADPDFLLALVREGAGHTPPGAYKVTEISDKQVLDLSAYLVSSPGS